MRPSKRNEIVEKALAIFYRNGFHATGMDMLVAETGISKTSMYKHFRTKEDLIVAALRLRDETIRNWLFRRMEELTPNPRNQLVALFDALGEWFEQPDFQGCLFIKASSEFQEASHLVHKQAADHKNMLHQHFTELAKAAGAKEPQNLAQKILLLKEGAIVTAHFQKNSRSAMDAKAAAAALLDAEFSEAA